MLRLGEPPGPALQRLIGEPSREEAVRQIRRDNPRDALPALQLARALDTNRIYLLSRLAPGLVEDLEMIPIGGPEELVRLTQRNESCLVLANAVHAMVQWKAIKGALSAIRPRTWPRFAAAWPRPPLGPVVSQNPCGWWASRNTSGWMRFGPWSPPVARIWAKAGRNSFGTGPSNCAICRSDGILSGISSATRSSARCRLVTMVHSLDSLRLAETIDAAAGKLDRNVPVLLEVNISREPAKHGFVPEEIGPLLPELFALKHIDIRGLMCMAGLEGGGDEARRDFATLRTLRDRLHADCPAVSLGRAFDGHERRLRDCHRRKARRSSASARHYSKVRKPANDRRLNDCRIVAFRGAKGHNYFRAVPYAAAQAKRDYLRRVPLAFSAISCMWVAPALSPISRCMAARFV